MGSTLSGSFPEMVPGLGWIAGFAAAITTVLIVYLGVAMLATLRATDTAKAEIRYRVFRDLLQLFQRRGGDR